MSDAPTAKGRATRARIVEGAAQVLREQGVAVTTLDDIRSRTGTSKSQLFHYFPDGKSELLLAVARFEADRVLEDQQPYLGCLDSWQAWRQWRDVVVERYERQGDSCPLGALFLQVGRSSPGARAIVTELMRQWQRQLAHGMRALQANGLVPAALDVDRTAAALLAGIQGGVTIMMSTGDSTHLRAALDTGIEHLRASGAESGATTGAEGKAGAGPT
ncbi:TetR family transcriptional regulator [Streptomyces sp. Tue6028]|uniref:TetR/AcrR family transcriptional regulator n=1 Tax=Streptomyces sp. Tue6028 TaxID=2036037 RepID=UPI000BB33BE2|nr:TetR/AcrR family transcriptional regulator [Streptomyces sp. Tue6028]PBC62376.1 TetR family transcriptional regulator [Streptomyces sp. Tue6028]